MSVKKITAAEFPAAIAVKNRSVLIKFFAVWCGPCRQFAPILEKFAANHPEVDVYEMDIDPQENIQVIEKFAISTVPTIICFRNGEITFRTSGFLNQRDLDKLPL